MQLLVLLLCPPTPFRNSEIDVHGFVIRHLLAEEDVSEEVRQ